MAATGSACLAHDAPLSFSPYDYRIHEDPYPVYARLRDEAPLYRNGELDFWALSRYEDVAPAFRDSKRLSSANGVSLDPSAWGPDAHTTMSFLALRQEDLVNRWTWIPFGAGRHRRVGSAFAMMQLKAIFSVLLRAYEFELAQPPETYRNDHSKMVVQLPRPCAVRYRRRNA